MSMINIKAGGESISTFFRYLSRTGRNDDARFQEPAYDMCAFQRTDRWLDVGAHTGYFLVKHAKQVEHIECIEIDRENSILLHAHAAMNKIGNWTHQHALLNIDSTELDGLIKAERINKVKFDMGTSIMQILTGSKQIKYLDELIFKCHYGEHGLEALAQLKIYLKSVGFLNVTVVSDDREARTQIIYCNKIKI